VRKADNLPPSCAVVMKSGNLDFLEPSGSLKACNGTDLPYVNVTGHACHRQTLLAVGILRTQLHTLWFYMFAIYCPMPNLHGIFFMWFCVIGTGAYIVCLYNCLILRAK